MGQVNMSLVDKTAAKAKILLRSPRFFNEVLGALKEEGLAGEERNALALYIVAVSRLSRRPLNAIVKGQSSTGKNWLVTRVLRLLPKDSVREITTASDAAWNYSSDDFRHRVVYLQERNQGSGTVHPMRLLISEGKLVRAVTVRSGRGFSTERYVTRGPIASISTTTKNQLELDDETRHVSLWVDESVKQTKRIVKSYLRRTTGMRKEERDVWKDVQRLLQRKTNTEVEIPHWFDAVAEHVYAKDVRVRRYFPSFIEACRIVSLIRSYQRKTRQSSNSIVVTFADFAVTALIFDGVFVESLHRGDSSNVHTSKLVRRLEIRRSGKPVSARLLANELDVSIHRAYRLLREGIEARTIRRANKPQKGNRKLFVAAEPPRFVPDPELLFRRIDTDEQTVRFVHPLTGKWITYQRSGG